MTALQLQEPPIQERDQLLTKEEACKKLQISIRKFNYMLAHGEVTYTKIGAAVRIHPEDLREYIMKNKKRGTA